MSTLSLTVAQFAAGLDIRANRDVAVQLIDANAATSDLVVLPENAMYSDPKKERPDQKHHETLEGEFVSALKAAARRGDTHVLAGFTETNEADSRPFNTLVHISNTGELEGVYRKIHLYDAFGYRESDTVMPAPVGEPLIFDINGIKVGALTCYDLRFPEATRWLVDNGADVLALPTAWVAGPMKELHWETLLRARAIENTIYVAGCGQSGPHCAGQSMIIDPMGVVVAAAGEAGMASASAVVSPERISEVRKTNPSLENRRFSVAPLPR